MGSLHEQAKVCRYHAEPAGTRPGFGVPANHDAVQAEHLHERGFSRTVPKDPYTPSAC
jgi:hypothetical protein